MKTIRIRPIVNRNAGLATFALLAVILTSGHLSSALAQGSQSQAIEQAQQAVKQQIISQEGSRDSRQGGRNMTVLFNNDAQSISRSRAEVQVRGTGTLSRGNDSRYDNSRNNDGRARDFSYEAIVNTRTRYRNVSGIRYDWSGGNNARDHNDRDHNDRGNNDRDNNDRGNGAGNRPNGRVSYSGPISNRHSDKALDVTERSNQDGANIQQWSYADQPNQNWDVIDLGNGEAAIISRQSGRALTVQGGRDNNGANIIQQRWSGSRQQRWRLESIGGDYYRIVSVDNGKCLDVTQQGRQDGANIQLWNYANQANQQWRLRR
jgi:hypothetical protein